ncbi:MAG: PAS domain S-box protein, partial [Thermodesulfobacteriota bacterium]
TDLERNVLFWNKGSENIFGYKAEEITGRQKIDILYHNDEAKKIVEEIRPLRFENKRGTSIDIKEATKDGRELWMNLSLTPRFDEENNVIGFLGIGNDISERKQAEEALEKAYDELEVKVEERTKKLKEETEKLVRMNKLFVDRELMMKELKEEIKKLKRKM